MSSQVASLTSFLKKSMKQKEGIIYLHEKSNKGNEKLININYQEYREFLRNKLKCSLYKFNR